MNQYDDYWKKLHLQKEQSETQKSLNPLRILQNIENMVFTTSQDAVSHNQPIREDATREFEGSHKVWRGRQQNIRLKKIERELQAQYMYDQEGKQITFEDWEYANKYIDFKRFEWSEENPIDYKAENGERIANYRQTVPEGVEKKGTVFFIHGYGCTVKNHAYLGHMFASEGFEFCGID